MLKQKCSEKGIQRIVHFAILALIVLSLAWISQGQGWAQRGGALSQQIPPALQRVDPNALRVYIWAGPKTHGAGQHDYPLFLAQWSELLSEHGATVDGSLHPPTSADLARTNVVILYAGDAGFLTDEQKNTLNEYVKRGGGLVSLHDSICGPDPAYLASLFGGGKKHGETNFTLEAPITYTVVDKADPIMKDYSDFTIWDESFFLMTWAKDPGIHVLANNVIPGTPSAGTHKGEVAPQVWTYEHTVPGGQPARAFVWMQGHTFSNFSNYQVQRTLLRGIAWAGKRPVDQLVDYVAPQRTMPAGGRGAGAPGGAPGGGRGFGAPGAAPAGGPPVAR